jgi:hypothetical protein
MEGSRKKYEDTERKRKNMEKKGGRRKTRRLRELNRRKTR